MTLLSDLLGLKQIEIEEAKKKPKCTCDKDEATCKVHGEKLDENKDEDGFDDSVEFTEQMTDVLEAIKKINSMTLSDNWAKWMKLTDQNFGTDTADALIRFNEAFTDAKSKYDDFLDEIDKAQ